jgi:hypothetical protein
MVREGLREDPLSGHWFVFRNRRGDRFKLRLWDEDGLMLVYRSKSGSSPTIWACSRSKFSHCGVNLFVGDVWLCAFIRSADSLGNRDRRSW